MRFLITLSLLVLVLGFSGPARQAQQPPAPSSHIVLVGASDGRSVRNDSVQPQFLGGWWKTFKKILEAFVHFIDAIIDATLPGGDEGGEGTGDVALVPQVLVTTGGLQACMT